MHKFYFLIGLLVFCSCSLTPFTQQLYDENGWSEQELKRIQFYVSETLILQRELREGESKIASGVIKMKDGRRIERVTIPKNTPGVLVDMPKSNRFVISFEPNNDAAALRFGPNPRTGNQYVLMAKDWNRGRGRVLYEGREYLVMSQNAMARLMVDLRKQRDEKVRSRTARGRKID